MLDLQVYTKTDIGLVRKENQDSAAYSVISNDCIWAVVCDGMGGVSGGKIASSLAVEHISEVLEKAYRDDLHGEQLSALLIRAVDEANSMIYRCAMENPDYAGMGTTCDLALVRGSAVHIVHVGDSRTYSVRGRNILQLTEDHSVVQEMVNRGEITPDEALRHPNKHYITRAIGVNHEVHIDYIEAEYEQGDVILICSDGLSNYVSKADMIRVVNECKGDLMVDTLVELAKRHGGHDNITVTVIY